MKRTTRNHGATSHHPHQEPASDFRDADEYGFIGAVRRFGLDRKTVRTWQRRWMVSGWRG
ncbi:MAG: hypothetical protein H8K05_15630 [Nitrospira sp.]|nr:hypothetical protein [Nitrospira sp.]